MNGGFHGVQVHALQLQDLPLGSARRDRAAGEAGPYDITYIDRDNRPDWFLAISPHSKVPVLQIDGKDALFESNAIAEYLEETAAPRLHPEDPIARARNRAWTDYVTTFASAVIEHGVCRFGRRVRRARAQDRPARSASSRRRSPSAAMPGRISTGRSCRWSMRPTRRSCSAIPSWTGCGRSASSRNFRISPRGAMRCSPRRR